MSLAQKIRDLIDGDLTNAEIAEQVGTSLEYVRATRSRYLRPEITRAWEKKYRATEEYKVSNRAYQRGRYHANPEHARKLRRQSYERCKARQLQPA